jgi:hypothetical protein
MLWGVPAYPPFVYVIDNMSPELPALQESKVFARRKARRTLSGLRPGCNRGVELGLRKPQR